MNRIPLCIVTIIMLSSVQFAYAQSGRGSVIIHSDARLAVLLRKTHSYVRPTQPEAPAKPVETIAKPATTNTPPGLFHPDMRVSYTGKGYRVQIYNGPSRDKALQAKTEFMRRFPGVSSYIMYMAPGFRVKIGDYRNRSDAEGMLKEANSMFSPSMIVPDVVTISNY